MIILIIAAIAFMFLGFFSYNPIRRKYAGIIGVGGSYVVLLGVMLLFSSIGQIIGTITGKSNVSALEIVLGVVVMLLCLGYMVFVMLTRCETVAQRILQGALQIRVQCQNQCGPRGGGALLDGGPHGAVQPHTDQ